MFTIENVVLSGDGKSFVSGIVKTVGKVSENEAAKAAKKQVAFTFEFDLAGAKLEPVLRKSAAKWVIECAPALRKRGTAWMEAHKNQKVMVAEIGTHSGGFKSEVETVGGFLAKLTPEELANFTKDPQAFMTKLAVAKK